MSKKLFDSPEFLNVVRTMRTWDAHFRHLALYASMFWDDERLDTDAHEFVKNLQLN